MCLYMSNQIPAVGAQKFSLIFSLTRVKSHKMAGHELADKVAGTHTMWDVLASNNRM